MDTVVIVVFGISLTCVLNHFVNRWINLTKLLDERDALKYENKVLKRQLEHQQNRHWL